VGEARVKVSRAGICATDLELVKGYYPFRGIPGHEFVGTIVQAPDRPERVGQRVGGEINIGDFSNGKNMDQIMAGWHPPKFGLSQ
jgi:threonine dehydrogenase-like Zn-dependent dehydrogenase